MTTPSRRNRDALRLRSGPVKRTLALVILLTNCASPPAEPDKYAQTWPQRYSDTTCSEWLDSMSEPQRFAAAADMLVGARSRDGSRTLPDDSVITSFQGDIGEACTASRPLAITEVAATIYVIGKAQYGP